MWEIVVVVLTVLAAATGVSHALYRSVSGKTACAGCRGCAQTSDPETALRPRGICHAEGK